MSRVAGTYGRRGRLGDATSGIRQTAPTYGKARRGTYAEKAQGHIKVESDAERFVSHLLEIDPRVTAFQPQPFTVDLIDASLLTTPKEVWAARRAYHDMPGPRLYTPDFSFEWEDGFTHVCEVKTQGYEGDSDYQQKLERARVILDAYNYAFHILVMPANTAQPLRRNVQLLKQAKRQCSTYLTEEVIERVEAFCEHGPVTAKTLCSALELPAGMLPIFLVSGLLSADIAHQPILGALEVSLAYGALDHLCLLHEVAQ